MNNLLLNNNKSELSTEIKNIRHINKIKEQNEINKIKDLDIKTITDIIIKPVKENKTNSNIENEYKNIEKDYKNNLSKYWNERTNVIYKRIIDEDVQKKINNKEDLIVHKVKDQDNSQILNQYNELKQKIDEQNKHLKEIYSEKDELKHKKNFEYSYRLKNMKKYNPEGFKEMKNNVKKENINNELNKENMVNQLVSNGIFNDDELKMFGL